MKLGPLGMAPWGKVEAAPAAAEVFPPADGRLRVAGQRRAFRRISAPIARLRYIHRRIGEADVYFVANGAAEDCEADLFVPRCRQAAGTVASRDRQRHAAHAV